MNQCSVCRASTDTWINNRPYCDDCIYNDRTVPEEVVFYDGENEVIDAHSPDIVRWDFDSSDLSD